MFQNHASHTIVCNMSDNGESRNQERPELDEMPEQRERQETPSLSDDDVDSLGKQIKTRFN